MTGSTGGVDVRIDRVGLADRPGERAEAPALDVHRDGGELDRESALGVDGHQAVRS
jgi:hypothetical protein